MGLATVGEAIDGLLAVDLSAMSDAELHDVVAGLYTEDARWAAVRSRFVSAWETRKAWSSDGSKTPGARLARECGLSPATARAEVRRAKQLRSMPVTAAALAAGSVSLDHVDALCRANGHGREEAFARDEPCW